MSKFRWLLALCTAVALAPVSLLAQGPVTVTGRVTGDAGAPVASAAVRIDALNVGTVTGEDGTYRLVVPAARVRAGQQVQVTAGRVGFATQSRPVTLTPGANLTQNFQLAADVLQLEGIVATGLGTTTTRERLGVTVSSVQSQELNRVQHTNVVNALAGKAANVEITSSSGEPGASSYIRIRGVKTITGSGQPLFVVDGVPIDNSTISIGGVGTTGLAGTVTPNRASDINPQDIESVEILKGAAASAIYGARAANGVVLITTKSGRPGETRVSLNTTVTMDEVNKAVPLQRSWAQGDRNRAQPGAALRSWGPQLTGESFDHWGELFETGRLVETNLNLSGGSERTTYFLSLGRSDHNGTITGDNDFYEKTTARLKGSHELSDVLRVSGNFAYTQTDGSFIQKGSNLSGLLLGGLRTPPDFNNCIPGTCYRTDTGRHRSYAGVFDNPFFTINENRTTGETGRMYGNIELGYNPLTWLDFRYTLGNDYTNEERLSYLNLQNLSYPPGYLDREQYTIQQLTHTLVGTARRQFGDAIGTTLTVGYDRNSRSLRQYLVEGYDFIAPGVFQLDNTITREPNEYRYNIHSESFFGQAQAEIADQLFLTAAARNDGFSTFGESEKRHWYPKFSAAWEFTEALGWDEGNSPLGFGKIRAAWGQAGNEPPVYGTIGGFSTSIANFTDTWGPALNPATFGGNGGLYTDEDKAQPDLGPERTTEFEAGADFSFLQDRVGLGVTFYNAHTEGAIFQTPLSPSTGFLEQLQNVAEIRNRGWEVNLDLRPVRSANFSWEAGLVWATNDNEVLDLGEGREFVGMFGAFSGAPGAAVVGHPVGVLRGNDFARCGQDNRDFVAAACQGAPNGALYINANGFPIVDPTTRVIMNPHPDWTAGVRNTFTLFNGLQISGLLDIKQGGQVWNGTRGALYSYGTHMDTQVRAVCTVGAAANQVRNCTGNEQVFGQGIIPGAVVGPGAGKAVPIGQNWYHLGLGSGFGAVASQFIEDGSYVKLREIALGYSIPATFSRRVGMSSIDLRLAGRNLKTWTDYSGIDPETSLAGARVSLRGIDYFNNPQTRTWIFTVGLHR